MIVAVCLFLVVLGTAWAQQPAPVSPTVPSPTITPVRPRLATITPGSLGTSHNGEKNDTDNKNGSAKKENVVELSLGDCIAIALERNPGLRAVRSSQQATGTGLTALNNIGRIGSLLRPDLQIRKEQASRGVIAAAAAVQQKHNEIIHDVTRMYYTAVYAHQQSLIADDVLALIELTVKIAQDQLNSDTPRGMTRPKLIMMQLVGLDEVELLRDKAKNGEARAYAGLRMLMAMQDESFVFRVKDKELPLMKQVDALTQARVVEMALCNRPELALMAAGTDAFRLEVYAQAKVRFSRSVATLASGSDIHSAIIPSANRSPGQEYRPEPTAPEMPPQVHGRPADRVARVKAYSQRADGAYESLRNLIELEATETYLFFKLSQEAMIVGKRKFTRGRDLMTSTQDAVNNPNAPREDIVRGYATAAKAQSDYVESVFQYLLALTALERVTAGGVKPEFPDR